MSLGRRGRLDSPLVNTRIGFVADTETATRTDPLPTHDGDHERLSHYVDKHKLTEAMVMGSPVIALCGKVWVPSRAPEKYPVCPECEEVYLSLRDAEE